MDRGTCPECGKQTLLRQTDGMVRRHGDCPGGGQPPAESMAGVGSGLPAGDSDNQASSTPPHAGQTAIYLVRAGKRNPELEYSLRSLQANTTIERVILVGYRPPWVTGVEHIPTEQTDRAAKSQNMRRGYEAIAEHGPDEFVLFNDDMFVMHDVPAIEPTHRGPLSSLLHKMRPTSYYRGLKAASELLDPDALAYDAIHTPLPLTRKALAVALDRFDGNHGLRTVAANLAGIGGTRVPNAKNPDRELWPQLTYLSTNDKSFRYGDIGAYIRRRFREPSRWEVPA